MRVSFDEPLIVLFLWQMLEIKSRWLSHLEMPFRSGFVDALFRLVTSSPFLSLGAPLLFSHFKVGSIHSDPIAANKKQQLRTNAE